MIINILERRAERERHAGDSGFRGHEDISGQDHMGHASTFHSVLLY